MAAALLSIYVPMQCFLVALIYRCLLHQIEGQMSIFLAICNRFALKCIHLDHQWPALCSKNILLKSNKVRSQEFIKTSSWHIEIHCLRILIFCVQGMRSFQNAACGLWSKHGVLYANQSSQIHVNQETIGMSPAWDKYSTRHIKVGPIKN